ncbi:MAG: hypothetical protein ABFS28_10035 [Bacteroidota bacterium]
MVLILTAGLFAGVSAQKTGISASFGRATFAMDDMKYLQENILESYPLEGAVISSFPPYFTGTVRVVHQFFMHLRAGAGYTLTSTGGRTDYSDYSGNVETNMTAVSHRFGVSVNYSILGGDRLDLSLYGKLDANLSKLDISSTIRVLGHSNRVQNKYKSLSPSGSTGLELLYNFKDSALGIEAGYLVDLPGDLSNKETGNDLLDPNDRQRILTTDWTGWRIGIKGIVWIR